jgi:hypothetical protein
VVSLPCGAIYVFNTDDDYVFSVRSSVADPDPFHMDPDPAFQFDPDPYRFREVMYLKQYFFINVADPHPHGSPRFLSLGSAFQMRIRIQLRNLYF